MSGREDFFAALFEECSGLLELRPLPSKARTFIPLDRLALVEPFIAGHAGENLYFGVATRRDGSSGALDNCQHLGALFADLDFKVTPESEARKRLAELPLPPSIIVASGGGLHPYWLLREPMDLQTDASRVKHLLRRLARDLGGDLSAAEPARILRIPGTLNFKYFPPRLVRLELFDPARRYNPSEFEWLLPQEPVEGTEGQHFTVPETIKHGERNSTLYRLARSLKARGLSPAAALAALREENQVRCEPPLSEGEVTDIAEGAAAQTDRPDFRQAGGSKKPSSEGIPRTTPVLVRLSDVEPEEVPWLWPGRIALGKPTLLIGDPGKGKSYALLDLAARVTRGQSWPDRGQAPQGQVILLTAEDGLADTVRPRLDAQGGDPARVTVLQAVGQDGIERGFSLAVDIPALEEAIVQTRAVLVIIDPLSAYLGRKTDSYKDAEVRAVLAPLAALAERYKLAVVSILHMSKDAQRQALYRAQGSIAFVAAARAVFAVAEDPETSERRLCMPIKMNLAPLPPTLAFRITDTGLEWEPNPVDVDVEIVLGGSQEEDRADRQGSDAFLRELLEDGPVLATQVLKAGEANGFGRRTLQRAKRRLGIRADRIGGLGKSGQWFWMFPAKGAIPVTEAAKGAIPLNVALLDESPKEKAESAQGSAKSATSQGVAPLGDGSGPLRASESQDEGVI